MESEQKDNRSVYGGTGKYPPHPLSASYNPPGDKEGATWNGLRPIKKVWQEES